jgi:hypothetical protein
LPALQAFLFEVAMRDREVPMMRVEVDGVVVRRPGVLDVLQYNSTGKVTMSRMRPQTMPGEVLIERNGTFPAIVGAVPSHVQDILRHHIIGAVTGKHPAALVNEADPVALNCFCYSLADAAEAKRLLCTNGYAWPARSLTDMVRTLLGLDPVAPSVGSKS